MTIILNGEPRAVAAGALDAALAELGYGGAHVATAVNGEFVPRDARAGITLREGDRLEVLAPLQGG
ncbi:MAG: sulfur carrier protein ThiS [Thermohalobaculum sp.]|nr:sulfur carrier protein ThiS [Thermohalobaculum sp.]